jgi:hypothetical protein
MTFYIKNWESFQHYKDRAPPWIKLHKSLLDNYEYQCLPVDSKALAPMLWLLASENADGAIPSEIEKIAFRLRMTRDEVVNALKPLIDKGFVVTNSTLLSGCLQMATSETETETETERVATRKRNSVFPKPDDVDQELWDAFVKHRKVKKAPITEIAIDGIRRECKKAGWQINDAIREIIERNWQSFKAQWVEGKSFNAKPAVDPFEGAL